MTERDDITLLREFSATESEDAFAALVQRHINLVYSTALRSTGSNHAAEEIAQAVFIILAQKARKLSPRIVLSGWLYQTTRLTAANFLRGEIRRQKREQEAYMQSTLNEPDAGAWPQIAPLLDGALDKLSERDRNAIVLRFFENKSLAEVGEALDASEDAAKMRVNRALEKLRKIFGKRGVALSATLIAGAVSASSVQAAPAGLAATISTVAITKGAAAGGSTLALVKGALKIMAWTKAKTAIVVGAIVLLAAGTTTVTVKEIQRHNDSLWNTGKITTEILRTGPNIVRIIPSKFPQESGVASLGEGRFLGVGDRADQLVMLAYGSRSSRTIFQTALPPGQFDFIANLLSGSEAAFRRAVGKQFGIVGRRQTVETNVLFLIIKSRNAPGLRPSTTRNGSSSANSDGHLKLVNIQMAAVANSLESQFGIPIIDQTGLTGSYDVDLQWNRQNDPQHENFKQALRNQLGMEVAPGTAPVEMLVVEKAK
jgi:uncharacterized protein (TIGR03435 family)